MVWIEFVVCLAIIIVAGSRLAKYGDLIAEKTGIGRVWIGVVLLATVTSLPELATGISSVTLVGKPDLTIGNLFGASLSNLAIVAVIDIIHRRGPALHYLGTGIVLSTVLSLSLIASAATALYLAHSQLSYTLFGRVGVYSIGLFVIFLLAQYMVFRFHSITSTAAQEIKAVPTASVQKETTNVIALFSFVALVIVAASIWLSTIGSRISEQTGLSASFVGTVFLAISTTAPEIVVSISAARLGALEMAVGNTVGSNLFNLGFIIFVDDLFYSKGAILHEVDSGHIITALFAILMSCVIIIGILFKPKYWLRGWVSANSVLLIGLYLGAMITLYVLSKPA